MSGGPTRIVAAGYDRLAERYWRWASEIEDDPRHRMTAELMRRLAPGARVLDLGCGPGIPSTRVLAEGFVVTGVDGSESQLRLARANVPAASFILADFAAMELPTGSFDAVTAFYSISHVPRLAHAALFRRITRWLVPGGWFLASLGATDSPDWTGPWLDTPMFFSAYDADTNRDLLRAAGFELIVDEVVEMHEPEGQVSFLWVLATTPA